MSTVSPSSSTNSIQRYQIRLHAGNLPRVRGTTLLKGPPDVFCLVTSVEAAEDSEQPKATQWGTTEVIHKSHHPQWTKTVPLEHVEGTEKFFYVHVMRVLDRDISKRKSLGTALFEVNDILNTHSRTRVKRLRKGGCVFCHLESFRERDTTLFRFQFSCLGMHHSLQPRLSLLRQSSVVVEMVVELAVARTTTSGTAWVTVFRSKPTLQSPEVTWDRTEIDLSSAFQGSMMLPLKVTVFTVKRGNDTVLGCVETSIRQLLNAVVSEDDVLSGQLSDINLHRPSRGDNSGSSNSSKEVAKLRVLHAELIGPFAGDDCNKGEVDAASRSRLDSESSVTKGLGPKTPNASSSSMSPVRHHRNRRDSADHDIVFDFAALAAGHTTSPSYNNRIASASTIDDDSEIALDPYAVDLAKLPIYPLPSLTHRMPTFYDYIADGCDIDFCVAIDFTSSNGDPRIPGSLHHQSSYGFNDYEETITSIGNAVSSYSASKEFVVWGFGAKFNGVVRHLFQCGTGKTVNGVDGILSAYQGVFQNDITMSGPTVFVQAIQAAAIRAKSHHTSMSDKLCYTVLLIVTDGIMDDFPETKRRLALYSEMPLSIVLVGVGKADFRTMYDLCHAEQGMRRNTTFVEFWRHQYDPTSLGKAALEDVPSQLVSYMVQNGIFPIGSRSSVHR